MIKENIKILLVDDEPDILEILSYNLNAEGYNVLTASNGLEAVKLAKKHVPNLILMDVMMPEMDGIEACGQIRLISELKDIIIALLTARGEDYSKLAGFEAGADDYITKPIKPKVLISKIKALLRRQTASNYKNIAEVIKVGELIINRETYQVVYRGKDLVLPRKEFELLSLLVSKPGKVYKRDEILDRVWGNEVVVGGRTIDVHIRKLRKKFGDDSFKTVKGVGYKFAS